VELLIKRRDISKKDPAGRSYTTGKEKKKKKKTFGKKAKWGVFFWGGGENQKKNREDYGKRESQFTLGGRGSLLGKKKPF